VNAGAPAVHVEYEKADSLGHEPERFSLATLGDGRLRVLSPVQVTVRFDENAFVASAEAFNEFGYGESQSDAVKDLQHALAELYFSLTADESRLSKELADTLSALRSSFRQVA
jgi:hypothetical protein